MLIFNYVPCHFCYVYLLIFNGEMVWQLMITEENKQKRQSRIDPALRSLTTEYESVFELRSVK